ncbi:helix-turn-helix domain-containing protein [uncultured Subdoligranulum sp.]|uniref:helix-turn-helix domain-containing protein n=1 Tax=uncultured Subdoligranulum sp. TaxID=512298 RepID=UPI0025FA5682|nr:helix-turn-helix domain-containing protein [uncultured Subdoligranulum sp.]
MFYYDVSPEEFQDLPEILKPTEVAEFLCIHKNTVYKLIKRGDLPAFRVGKSWRISRRDLSSIFQSLE